MTNFLKAAELPLVGLTQRWGYVGRACLRVALATAVLFPWSAHADWNQANDEANRQRMMNSMRASAAASERRSNEALERSQNAYKRNYGSSGGTSGTGGTVGRTASAGTTYQPSSTASSGRDVVETTEFTVFVKETEAQTIARVKREAQDGNKQSQYNLGRILYTGYGVARDDAGARLWFGAAAKQGHPAAQAQYGAMLVNGQGGAVNIVEGMDFIRKASSQGDSYAQALDGFFSLAELYKTPGSDMEPAIATLNKAASRGEMLAQATLGSVVYLYGVGTERDHAKAVTFLKLAAAQRERGAMADLARFYLGGGGGLDKDEVKGLELLKAAVELKQRTAQAVYAVLLIEGRLVPKDWDGAYKYALASAMAADELGQVVLAKCHYFGHGTPKNLVESVRWFRKAAVQGNAESIQTLLEPDLAEAAKSL